MYGSLPKINAIKTDKIKTIKNIYYTDPRYLLKKEVVVMENKIKDGAVVIASITSCTNTSSPSVMLAAGILDPTKVVRNALSNAASIAGLMLTTQVLVTKSEDAEGGKKPASEGVIR